MNDPEPEPESQPETAARAREVQRVEWRGQQVHRGADWVATEEPLEIRVGGTPIAVVMRTPGHDEELVTGFLLSERIVADAAAIASVRHCTTVTDEAAEDNVMQAVVRSDVDLASLRRNFFASSSCGVCGKASIEQAMGERSVVARTVSLDVAALYTLPSKLETQQPTFAQTGGLHAAGLFAVTESGLSLIAAREDVGRHNAVDKVLGAAARTHARGTVLMLSGRVSFEIVQKAVACGVELIAAISAPSSLAVDLAQDAGVTLIGFLRGERLCAYAHPNRIKTAHANR